MKDADMIVLLGGGERQRWQEAVKLYKDQPSRIILITETGDTINEIGTRYSLLVRNNLSAMGVPMITSASFPKFRAQRWRKRKACRNTWNIGGMLPALWLRTPIILFAPA